MAEHDDRVLRELYNRGRAGQDEKAPDFEAMMQRAEAAAHSDAHQIQGHPAPWGRWLVAAAVAFAIIAALIYQLSPNVDGAAQQEAPRAESVATQESAPAAVAIGDDDKEWEQLLEFSDEVWAEEVPTDFLL